MHWYFLFHHLSFFFDHWLWHPLIGKGYSFLSGPLADITLLGGAIAIFRKHTCHINRCLRLGRHPVDGTPYVVCKKHHPDVPDKITPEHINASVSQQSQVYQSQEQARPDFRESLVGSSID